MISVVVVSSEDFEEILDKCLASLEGEAVCTVDKVKNNLSLIDVTRRLEQSRQDAFSIRPLETKIYSQNSCCVLQTSCDTKSFGSSTHGRGTCLMSGLQVCNTEVCNTEVCNTEVCNTEYCSICCDPHFYSALDSIHFVQSGSSAYTMTFIFSKHTTSEELHTHPVQFGASTMT
ncbi:uncharacterized protein V6R79_003247 [Siganus canaliculatus]